MAGGIPGLRKLDVTVLKNKSGSDPAQVPAAASVTVYRQGATSRTAVTLAPNETPEAGLSVEDIGAILKGDTVRVFRAGDFVAGSLEVLGLIDVRTLDVRNSSGSTLAIQVGDRLVVTNGLPKLYSDRQGQAAQEIGNPLSTDSATGRATAWVRESRFDYIASGSGMTSRLYRDEVGNLVVSPPTTLNALDFRNIQDALDAVPAGGTVVIPAGEYARNTHPAYTPPPRIPGQAVPRGWSGSPADDPQARVRRRGAAGAQREHGSRSDHG